MFKDKKISAAELFKDYTPEIMEYNPRVDAQYPRRVKNSNLKTEAAVKERIEVSKMQNKTDAKELFKDYTPEVLEYDEVVDGSDEHKIRENHLNTKEDLLEKIRKAKSERKSNKTTYRQNIRTENEK